jgi:phosphoribosylformylglycinamidine synthase
VLQRQPAGERFRAGRFQDDEIFYAALSGVVNPVIYVGGAKTVRDGIHGASMASAEFPEESKQKRPNGRWAIRFMEKLLLEACLEAMKTGAYCRHTGHGRGGLTCSTCEMGSRGGHRHRKSNWTWFRSAPPA